MSNIPKPNPDLAFGAAPAPGGASGAKQHYNPNTPSAGAPLDYSEVTNLRTALHNNARKCFGGWIFRAENHTDMPIVCHAIPNSYDRAKIEDLSKEYHKLNSLYRGIFPTYEGSVTVDDFVCFKFALRKDERSMRDLLDDPEREGLCQNLFRDLVTLLYHYLTEDPDNYSALCSISLDTVYLDSKGRISLLPLISINNEFPRGFPLEAGTNEMDDTTDLYTAALLTYQVLSGFEYEKPSEQKRMRQIATPGCLDDCMKVFASQRPSLAEVYNLLTADESAHGSDHQQPKSPTPDFFENMKKATRRTTTRSSLFNMFSRETPLEKSHTAGNPRPDPKASPFRPRSGFYDSNQ